MTASANLSALKPAPKINVEPELPSDQSSIENLLDLSFGLSRRTKTSYRLREGSMPVTGLSHVVRDPEVEISGAISYWPLVIGKAATPGLLLGPLAVHPDRQNRGIGLALMKHTLELAQRQGHALVILVGDKPYYARVGFAQVPAGQLQFPGFVDPARLLALELQLGALAHAQGLVLPPHRHKPQ
jgi:predicted N-acetyltransferase YhbS